MFALKLLLRHWRGGQLAVIVGALMLAVAVVTAVGLVAERVERALVAESSSFLAADRVIRSTESIPGQWIEAARRHGLQTARVAEFPSMVFYQEAMHLSSVKAVETGYPLRGALKVTSRLFDTDASSIEQMDRGPLPGEVWVDARLLPLLDAEPGDYLDVGEASLQVTRVLTEEPDRGGTFSLFGARVLMNWTDLEASGVIQPGSRVRYRLLLAGDTPVLDGYLDELHPQLTDSQSVLTPEEAEASLTSAMQQGRRFLLLAGSVGVVLASIALAMASKYFADGQLLHVALFKSWGISTRRVRQIYLQQTAFLAIAGSLVGMVLGFFFHELLLTVVESWLPTAMPAAGVQPWMTGFATGLLCLLGFTIPSLWHLPAQSPMLVIRRQLPAQPLSSVRRGVLGVAAISVLLLWYSGSASTAFSLLAGFAFAAAASLVLGYLLLHMGRSLASRRGSYWRVALSNLWRRRSQSVVQMIAFSSAITLLLVMAVIRTSLIDEWRWQLAEDAPNHFLVNVAPYQLDGIENLVEQQGLETAGWYSMVRARLTHINGEQPDEEMKQQHEMLNREVNLSWTNQLPDDNRIVSGNWWNNGQLNAIDLINRPGKPGQQPVPVSIETDVTEELGLALGDQLTFNVGGLQFDAVYTSSRALSWDNMTPNFYFLFPEGVLESFPRTYITSLYIPPTDKPLINDISRGYPTIQIIELDKIIDRIRTVITQVTSGLEMMSLLILGCGILVMFAAVNLSMADRLHESAILRVLGSSRRMILGVQWVEFSLLGFMSGLMAALGAEFVVFLLQRYLFSMEAAFHGWIWLAGPISGALLTGLLGVAYSRRVVVQAPLQVLRGLD